MSEKWLKLDAEFSEKCLEEKSNYYEKIVKDLKESNPGQWYSKVKRMSGQEIKWAENVSIPELEGLTETLQAEVIADHYAKISNSFNPLKTEDFDDYLKEHVLSSPPLVDVEKIVKTIRSMNKKSSTLEGDLLIKLLAEFAEELSFPLANIINECFLQGVYPDLWKLETVTPAPKVHPVEQLSQLRKISGLLNFSKVTKKSWQNFWQKTWKCLETKRNMETRKRCLSSTT